MGSPRLYEVADNSHPHPFAVYLDDPVGGREWLAGLGVREPEKAWRSLRNLAAFTPSSELVGGLLTQLAALLPRCPDGCMALTNIERFVTASADPPVMLARLAVDPRTTEVLVQLCSTSQFFSEILIRDPALLGWLRSGPPRPSGEALIACLWDRLRSVESEEERRVVLRLFRQREMLRIGYNDIVRQLPLETTTQDLSHLAEACVEAAYRVSRASAEAKHGLALRPDGTPARFVVLGLGKLGGAELNYSSDIDLIFMYDEEGQTKGPRPLSHSEFFSRLGGEMVRLLAEYTPSGQAYRVDLRLRPEGARGPLVQSLAATLAYYQTRGRTWERQALIKARPVAGAHDLGADFIDSIAPFVYRRYLSAAEIGEIRSMKRRIEQRTDSAGEAEVEVKTGRGGIRDVEFVAQFLQLLHGGTYPEVRTPNTLDALERLERVGCLNADERGVMEDTYRFLRRIEHLLQIMFDQQTHRLPDHHEELRAVAIRMGFIPEAGEANRGAPSERFLKTYRAKTNLNRRILNHLLYEAFPSDSEKPEDPVVDLVLDPDPDQETVLRTLEPFGFRDRPGAYRRLMALAREDSEFLSEARCRHFLAAIATRLLREISQEADPDLALTNLEKVSASLGAKAVLWELFSVNPPSLRLYVRLCATSQFLSDILINNPGMIDDLMDSLVIDRPQSASAIRDELSELCRGAEDLAPILLGFRNKEWVRIGARDILGREPIRTVTQELSDVAEAIVGQVASDQYAKMVERYGEPMREGSSQPCRWAIVAQGKFGGRELNYHSDLDLVYLYESDGSTRGRRAASISNFEFFTELARRVLRLLGGGTSGAGLLYRADLRLRPYGSSGPLVLTLDGFRTYHERLAAPWERLALTRARVCHARGEFGRRVSEAIREALSRATDPERLAKEIWNLRQQIERSSDPGDLKKGPGGQVDIEFIVQYLLLVYGPANPTLFRTNIWEALKALHRARLLDTKAHEELRGAYDLLRTVESRIRIIQGGTGSCSVSDPLVLSGVEGRIGRTHRLDCSLGESLAQITERVRARFHTILNTSARTDLTSL